MIPRCAAVRHAKRRLNAERLARSAVCDREDRPTGVEEIDDRLCDVGVGSHDPRPPGARRPRDDPACRHLSITARGVRAGVRLTVFGVFRDPEHPQ